MKIYFRYFHFINNFEFSCRWMYDGSKHWRWRLFRMKTQFSANINECCIYWWNVFTTIQFLCFLLSILILLFVHTHESQSCHMPHRHHPSRHISFWFGGDILRETAWAYKVSVDDSTIYIRWIDISFQADRNWKYSGNRWWGPWCMMPCSIENREFRSVSFCLCWKDVDRCFGILSFARHSMPVVLLRSSLCFRTCRYFSLSCHVFVCNEFNTHMITHAIHPWENSILLPNGFCISCHTFPDIFNYRCAINSITAYVLHSGQILFTRQPKHIKFRFKSHHFTFLEPLLDFGQIATKNAQLIIDVVDCIRCFIQQEINNFSAFCDAKSE